MLEKTSGENAQWQAADEPPRQPTQHQDQDLRGSDVPVDESLEPSQGLYAGMNGDTTRPSDVQSLCGTTVSRGTSQSGYFNVCSRNL